MRLAVFSDVHSNHHALKACLKEAEKQKADGYIFLGDYISDCHPNPHETMKLMIPRKAGNALLVRARQPAEIRAEPPTTTAAVGKRHYNRAPFYTPRRAYGGGSGVHLRITFMQTIDQTASVIRIATAHRKKRATLRPFSL